jgi:hypothetical protein
VFVAVTLVSVLPFRRNQGLKSLLRFYNRVMEDLLYGMMGELKGWEIPTNPPGGRTTQDCNQEVGRSCQGLLDSVSG